MVFDDTGSWEAVSVAEQALASGAAVTSVSRLDAPGASVLFPPATVMTARERLAAGRYEFFGGAHLHAIEPHCVRFGTLFTDRRREAPADMVVVVGFPQPERELSEALTALGVAHAVVGDAEGGNDLGKAIADAARVARAL